MAGFFSLLIGYIAFLIITYNKGSKIWKEEEFYRNDKKQYAVNFNKPVWFKGYDGDKEIYCETKTGREVFKGTDKNGLKRWYYISTKQPMLYTEDKRISESLNFNKTIALTKERKWCVAENFWDDTIINLDNSGAVPSTYLDDYKDRSNFIRIIEWNKYADEWNKRNPQRFCKKTIKQNDDIVRYYKLNSVQQAKYKDYFYNNNPLNQKVYLKNMRPYQLYLIGTSGTDSVYDPLIKKQYLIRFGNPVYFNFKTQHCISDKRLSSINVFWSKWYAITEKEYLSLIKTNEGLVEKPYSNKFDTPFSLSCLKPINMEDIAFIKGIKKPEWNLVNCGIEKAFDDEGNFIEK